MKTLVRDCIVLLSLAVIPALLTAWLHPHRPAFTWRAPAVEEVSLETIASWPPGTLWIDARDAESFARRHVPGAVLLNEDRWEALLPEFAGAWHGGQRVVVYCDSRECQASQDVALRLRRELGAIDVFVLAGGWQAWERAHP
ncbi:MAG TPA: rhodanese-like domain-containing protein [Candidatus Didemnitutus sp.]|nr:rhodanese-like domain-containing protein [Candidatus Didemnitutus sp.]